MIIICPCCKKKFKVDDNLIPDKGRNIQCGACDHVWFYKRPIEILDVEDKIKDYEISANENFSKSKSIKEETIYSTKNVDDKYQARDNALVKYKKKSQFTLGKFLSYIIVTIITFIGFVLILDTFKSQLYNSFPSLEFILFNLFETLKDINLFIKDLI